MSLALPSWPRAAAATLAVLCVAACADQPLAPGSDALATVASFDPTSNSANVYTGVDAYPYGWIAYVECARQGQGDLIQLSGEVVFRWHVALTPTGDYVGGDIAVVHQGSAVSLTDGTVYQAPLTNHVTANSMDGHDVGSNTLRYRFVGPGPENNLVVESTSVWNFTSEGLKVSFSDYTVTCGTDGTNVPGSNDGADPVHE